MDNFSLLRLCLLSLVQAATGLQSFDHLVIALEGDGVTLPCDIPSVVSCSSVNWNMAERFGSVTEVVTAGRVVAPNALRLGLLKDCSLEIHHLELNHARLYSCDSGAFNSSVSLQILQITESSTPVDTDTIELQCFLNTYKGYDPPHNKGIHIKWSNEDNTQLHGNRFRVQNTSDCLSKLIITKKPTDHQRKWKCQLTQDDTVKAAITYTTTIKDGVQEVFAAVGESVSLSCGDTSSFNERDSVRWAVGERTLTDDSSPHEGQTEAFQVNKDSSVFLSKVSALHAGNYQCSESTDKQNVFNRIRLHTVDVSSECGPGGDNLTLTCVLTCTHRCEKDFNLSWSGGSQNILKSGVMKYNNTLINRLFLPDCSVTDELTCSVHRDGGVVASKKWHAVNSLQTPAWAALPLGLLICTTAGGIYMYVKRKRNKDAGNEQPSIGMTPIYEVILDTNNEEPRQQRQTKRETTAIVYDLLQPVN